MGLDCVVRLNKRLHGHLPVATDLFFDMQRNVAILGCPTRKVVSQNGSILVECRRLGVHINQYPTAPRGHLNFRQVQLTQRVLVKFPIAIRVLKAAVEVPTKPMIGAADLVTHATPRLQGASAVQTRIVEPL